VPASVVEAWSTETDVSAFVLADSGGVPLAYGEIWFDADEDEAELARLIVAPAHRGRGLGRSLARQLAGHARELHPGLSLIALRVLPGNDAALRAYLAAGFVRVDLATEAAWNAGQRVAWSWMQLG
jgi:ribosomal protein S18 acetylase RimI-like enzyme